MHHYEVDDKDHVRFSIFYHRNRALGELLRKSFSTRGSEILARGTVIVDRMNGEGPKNLAENAKTNVFPQRSLLPKGINLLILYTTGIIYNLSRLAIMALALSSLRSMPDNVYVTNMDEEHPGSAITCR
jgi:hypothetical protein